MVRLIAIGADHGGAELKKTLVEFLHKNNPEIVIAEYGARDAGDSWDYPDVAKLVCTVVLGDEENTLGVVVCGTGIGISMAANKFPGIRCALVHDAFTARMAREHNNANILALGGRVTGTEVAKDALKVFLNAKFQAGRHQTRVDKLECLCSHCCVGETRKIWHACRRVRLVGVSRSGSRVSIARQCIPENLQSKI